MKKILVPYDFSRSSLDAFKFSISIAKKIGASIELVHVIELPVISDPLMIPIFNYDNKLIDDLNEKTAAQFDKIIAQNLHETTPVSSRQMFGHVASTLLDYAKRQSFDLIVIGSHGAGEVSEFIMGSNVMKIMRRSTVPVLVVKNSIIHEIKTIVFPHSLEIENQDGLVENVKALQKYLNARLCLVHINTPATFTADDVLAAKLSAFSEHYHLTNFSSAIYSDVTETDGIGKYTKMEKGDLIAMGTHGSHGIAHLLNVSLAEEIVHSASVPIWTYSLKNTHEAVMPDATKAHA